MPANATSNNRNVAVYYVVKGVRAGASGASILRALQANGLGYRTQNFYNDYNYYLNNAARLPSLTRAQRAWYLPASNEINYPAKSATFHKYNFNVWATNTQTGESSYRILSITSDAKQSPFQAMSDMANALMEKYSYLSVDPSQSIFQSAQFYSP